MPVYNDTPLATDPINQTQQPIRTNFTSIRELIEINHVDFDDPDNFGKHSIVTFPQQVQADAQAEIIYPDIGLYSAPYAVSTINELWFRNSDNVLPDIPFTASEYSSTTGWTYLPSGILLKWGVTGAIGVNSSVTVTAGQGPVVTAAQILSVQLTPFAASPDVRTVFFGGLPPGASPATDNQFIARSSTGLQLTGANYLMIAFANP